MMETLLRKESFKFWWILIGKTLSWLWLWFQERIRWILVNSHWQNILLSSTSADKTSWGTFSLWWVATWDHDEQNIFIVRFFRDINVCFMYNKKPRPKAIYLNVSFHSINNIFRLTEKFFAFSSVATKLPNQRPKKS